LSLALEHDEVVTIQPRSVADGLGAPFAGVWTLAMARRYVDEIVLPAVLAGRIKIRDGERVGVLLSGGNVEVSRLGEFMAAAGTLPGGAA
jgi:threonine dehydratase